jgi:2-amino-4-hydroxy-6-hydroxymethyldihydropteridine diphosphokinase
MSLFIATGSNLLDKKANLEKALELLETHFELIGKSRIYTSKAVDYTAQDDFLNQVLEFKTPKLTPNELIKIVLECELVLGRIRDISKGPRIIDIDILFIDFIKIDTKDLTIPHPRLFERSFVVLPLSELPGFGDLKKQFKFDFNFTNSALPIT